jgi:DNA-binding ferritin-like protein
MYNSTKVSLELISVSEKNREKPDSSTFSGLLFDFIIFKKEVSQFCSTYQDPDYFDFLKRLSELRLQLNSIVEELEIHFDVLDKLPYNPLNNSFEFIPKKDHVTFSSDAERISNVVAGLGNLIQSSRKAALEAARAENFRIESMLNGFAKEMEKSKWIFYMFSKY